MHWLRWVVGDVDLFLVLDPWASASAALPRASALAGECPG